MAIRTVHQQLTYKQASSSFMTSGYCKFDLVVPRNHKAKHTLTRSQTLHKQRFNIGTSSIAVSLATIQFQFIFADLLKVGRATD